MLKLMDKQYNNLTPKTMSDISSQRKFQVNPTQLKFSTFSTVNRQALYVCRYDLLVNSNVIAPQRVIRFAKTCNKLLLFTHVSTGENSWFVVYIV